VNGETSTLAEMENREDVVGGIDVIVDATIRARGILEDHAPATLRTAQTVGDLVGRIECCAGMLTAKALEGPTKGKPEKAAELEELFERVTIMELRKAMRAAMTAAAIKQTQEGVSKRVRLGPSRTTMQSIPVPGQDNPVAVEVPSKMRFRYPIPVHDSGSGTTVYMPASIKVGTANIDTLIERRKVTVKKGKQKSGSIAGLGAARLDMLVQAMKDQGLYVLALQETRRGWTRQRRLVMTGTSSSGRDHRKRRRKRGEAARPSCSRRQRSGAGMAHAGWLLRIRTRHRD
jgi:hypothetical protein